MTIGLDGTIYMGQAERKSKLYLYYPDFALTGEAGLNPIRYRARH